MENAQADKTRRFILWEKWAVYQGRKTSCNKFISMDQSFVEWLPPINSKVIPQGHSKIKAEPLSLTTMFPFMGGERREESNIGWS